jgi:hypothetical protein
MGMRGVCLTAGPLLMILGGVPLLFVYAFASMVPPELAGWEYWSEVLSRMFNFSDAGWVSLFSSLVVLVGMGLFVWGLAVVLADGIRCLTSRSGGK